MIGKTISHYKILEKLGEGGMGVVYKAEDTKLKRTVALKFLPPELTKEPEAKKRFIQEARAASILEHNNICNIHEIDETEDGRMFIAMAHYEGETLKEKIERTPLKIDEALNIAVQAAEGLNNAHKKGIVHRDIKAANIMITHEGVVKILDFGLAKLKGQSKLTKTGDTVGTVSYMSPEQTRGGEVDHRSDIWSLGVVLYEMITGQLPFKGEYAQAVVYTIINEQPEPLTALRTGVPIELERIVNKALAKDPSERYQHADNLVVDLRNLFNEFDSGTKTKRTSTTTPFQSKKNYVIAGAAAIILVAIIAFYIFILSKPVSTNQKSIAVLPFENMNKDEESEYFSDGLTEDIITQLSKINGLHVISSNSSMLYKNSGKSTRKIGKELNAAVILVGNVRRSGSRVRINSRLIETRTDRNIWAHRYDREMTDIFDIQGDVAEKIAEKLEIALLPALKKRIAKKPTDNLEAYQLYLKGRFYWNRRNEEDLQKAITYFEKAVTLDPSYALGYASLAETYVVIGDLSIAKPNEIFPLAEENCIKALSLDKDLAEAHAALGEVKADWKWDFTGAEGEYRKAIQLNPNYATAYQWLAELYTVTGRYHLAHETIRKAQELNPHSHIMKVIEATIFIAERKPDEGIKILKPLLHEYPDFELARSFLILTYFVEKSYDKAELELKKLRIPRAQIVIMAILFAYRGEIDKAHALLQKLILMSEKEYIEPFWIAQVYGILGELDEAFKWYEKAFEQRSTIMPYFKVYCNINKVRQDPRFKVMIKRIGLEK